MRNYVPKFNLPNLPIKQGRYKVQGELRQQGTFHFSGAGYGKVENILNW